MALLTFTLSMRETKTETKTFKRTLSFHLKAPDMPTILQVYVNFTNGGVNVSFKDLKVAQNNFQHLDFDGSLQSPFIT